MADIYLYQRQPNKSADLNVWMCFPECNAFSLSSLGYMWLFKQIDEREDINVERVTTDTNTTQININDLDVMCFSFSFDLDFINIFKMIENYNLALKSKERSENDALIMAGGPVITTNPEPFKDIFDFFIIGDGDRVNLETLGTIKECKQKGYSKAEILKELSKIEGVYVPYVSKQVKKAHFDLSECIYTPILSEDSFFKNTFIIEIVRGCYNRCGFCVASYLNLPVRFVDYETIIEKIELGLKYTNKIALLGALISAHPRFKDICEYIYNKIQNGENIEMSVSSLRADAITPELINMLSAAGQKNFTIAIEAASERLRKVANKNLTEEQIFKAIHTAKDCGLKGAKIYSMLGLPTETQEDIDEFIKLGKELKLANKGFDITFSFSTFVPKPHTPFQWCGREEINSLEKKQKYLQKELNKIGVHSKFSSPKWDFYQALVSKGDSSITDYLIEVYKEGGKIGAYKSAAKKLGLDAKSIVENNLDTKKELPWDFLIINPGKEFLLRERERLLNS